MNLWFALWERPSNSLHSDIHIFVITSKVSPNHKKGVFFFDLNFQRKGNLNSLHILDENSLNAYVPFTFVSLKLGPQSESTIQQNS